MMNEYKIVSSATYVDMEKSVQNFLNQGWRCQGGVNREAQTHRFIQAMVRKKPEGKKA